MDNVIWKPQAGSQEMFLSCPIFEVLYEGTRGPGKTDALLMAYAQHVGKGYGADWRGIIFRETYPQLEDVINKSKKWFNRIFPDAKYNEAKSFWRFKDGETLRFRQFRKEDDYWNYHGHEYPFIGWEELCNWANLSGYKRMMSCCRSSNPEVPRMVRATANPYGPGHTVVKERFRLPEWRWKVIDDSRDEDGELEPPRVAIFGTIWENKILLESDPGYISRLRTSARNEAELEAWLSGSWDVVSGGMFDDVIDQRIHRLPNFVVPDHWRITRSFDWGSSKPFSVGWWAISDGCDLYLPDGRVMATVPGDFFRIAEWYGWNGKPNEGCKMLARDIAKGIVERQVRWKIHDRVEPGAADSAIFHLENGKSVANDMAKIVRLDDGSEHNGIVWIPSKKGPGSRIMGWEIMRNAFKNAMPHPLGYPREEPGIFICERCHHFWRTIPSLPRDKDNPDDVDTNAEDHIGDEVRYEARRVGLKVGSSTSTGLY